MRVRDLLKGGMEGVWGVRSPSGGVGIEKEPRTEVWRSRAKWPSWQPRVGLSLLLRTISHALENPQPPPPPLALNLQNADHRAKEKTHSCCHTPALHQRRFRDKPERMGQGTPSNSPSGTLPLWKDWHQDSMVTSSTLRIKSKALFHGCPVLYVWSLFQPHLVPPSPHPLHSKRNGFERTLLLPTTGPLHWLFPLLGTLSPTLIL